jgi:hypothetical protein
MSFETCESDKHLDCLVYNVLQQKFNCKYLQRCAEDAIGGVPVLLKYFVEEEMTIKLFKEIVLKYCTVEERHIQCANFQMYEQGLQPPLELLPNGKKIKISDILLKKEIIID